MAGVIQVWKTRHILTGMLTFVPMLNQWRRQRESTGGSCSARYCYSVWFRQLITLHQYGFRINKAQIGELGPGDSLGMGLAALLSGAAGYSGLDIVPYSAKTDLERMLDELMKMYSQKERMSDDTEIPDDIVEWANVPMKAMEIRKQLRNGIIGGSLLGYRVPWTSMPHIDRASLDLIFSQAVLEHIDCLEETYRAMFAWLKPGGYASHVIDFGSHGRSPFWNGHWAYSDWQWKLVRGKREYLLNREPMSTHLSYARKVGFEVLLSRRNPAPPGLDIQKFASRFRQMDVDDAQTRGGFLILQKPQLYD